MFSAGLKRFDGLIAVWVALVGTIGASGDEPARVNPMPAEGSREAAPYLTTIKLSHREEVTALGFTPDGRKLFCAACSGRGAVVIHTWDPATGEWLQGWPAGAGIIPSLDFAVAPDNRLIVVSSHRSKEDGQWVNLWDDTTESVIRHVELPPAVATFDVLLSADAGAVAVDTYSRANSSDDRLVESTFRLFDLRTRKEIRVVPTNARGVLVAVASDFERVLTVDGTRLCLWAGGREMFVAQQVADGVAPDKLRRNDDGMGRLLQEFPVAEGRGASAVFSANGGRLLTLDGGSKGLVVWDTGTGKELRKWQRAGDVTFARIALSRDGRRVAAVDNAGVGAVWDVATGWQLLEFRGTPDQIKRLALSPDGKMLAVAAYDGTVQVFHLTPRRKPAGWSAKDLEALWKAMAGEGEAVLAAHRAAFALADAPKDAVPFLRERLRPSAPADTKKVTQLIADLDADDYEVRDAAFEDLRKLGISAEPSLREALERKPPAEVRLRIESLLKTVEQAEALRHTRAVRVLELIGDREACKELAALAAEKGHPWRASEAKAALDRLAATATRK
jgi:WD40 repeat protein